MNFLTSNPSAALPKILNFGSLNIDRVFRVPQVVRPGETLASRSLEVFAGGKGANQSIALARAGVSVAHCGKVGPDGLWLIEQLSAEGIVTRHVAVCDTPTGQALIQVADDGQNAIVLLAGANHELTTAEIDAAVADCAAGDWVLTQNETNQVAYIIERASQRGLPVIFNPAPCTPTVHDLPLEQVTLLIVNESEGASLSETLTSTTDPATILTALRRRLPATEIILTLGAAGVLYDGPAGRISAPACSSV